MLVSVELALGLIQLAVRELFESLASKQFVRFGVVDQLVLGRLAAQDSEKKENLYTKSSIMKFFIFVRRSVQISGVVVVCNMFYS